MIPIQKAVGSIPIRRAISIIMIRRAELKDSEDLMRILYQVHALHAQGRPDIFIEGAVKFSQEELQTIIESDWPVFYVYEEEGKVKGYVCLEEHAYEKSGSRNGRRELYIEDLCVDERYRHQGIASKLYDYVLGVARNGNYDALTLNVWDFNEAAKKFYEKMGMRPLKTIMEKKI